MTLAFAGLGSTGLVIESGAEATFVVPIYRGVPMDDCTLAVKVAGVDITGIHEYWILECSHFLLIATQNTQNNKLYL